MSWEGKYWGPQGEVQKARKRFEESSKDARDYVEFASVLYSASNRALAEMRLALRSLQGIFLIFRWLHPAIVLRREAVTLVDFAWFKAGDTLSLTPDNAETSIAIWRGAPYLTYKRKGKIELLLLSYLGENGGVLRSPTCSFHTRAFFISHALAIGFWQLESRPISDMEMLARLSEKSGELAQASRVWKHAAGHWQRLQRQNRKESWQTHSQKARLALQEARRLAESSSPDQMVKLRALR